MYQSENIEIWNLDRNIPLTVGSQDIVNIVGRVKKYAEVESFSYSLNKMPWRPIVFRTHFLSSPRLSHAGDFNIDTINIHDLKSYNTIIFSITRNGRVVHKEIIEFSLSIIDNNQYFNLSLEKTKYPQQVGQVVDGKWKVSSDGSDNKCLEILPEDAGLDRIILFGKSSWSHGYIIRAKLKVTEWTHSTHNVGLLFQWNPHLQGDGTYLPSQWSTGLGYYYSRCPGIRVRYGVNVHVDENGNKIGDFILQEKPLDYIKYLHHHTVHRICYRLKNFTKLRNTVRRSSIFSQIREGVVYNFQMTVHSKLFALTIWKDSRKKPKPQIYIRQPKIFLSEGSTGIIAYNCGVQVYEYCVLPYNAY